MSKESPLRWIRQQVFGVTQEGLAAIGGVSRPRVSRYETGADDPPFDFMRRVRAAAIEQRADFSADWFFEQPESTESPADAEGLP